MHSPDQGQAERGLVWAQPKDHTNHSHDLLSLGDNKIYF